MKFKKIILPAIITIVICSAFKIAADNAIQKLNASEEDIKKAIIEAAISGKTPSFNGYAVSYNNFGILKQIVKGKITLDKQETANSVMTYIKAYYNSPEFQTAYKARLSALVNPISTNDSFVLKKQYEQNLKMLEEQFVANKKYTTKAQAEKTANSNISASEQGLDQAMQMLKNNPQLAAQSGMTPEQIQQMMADAKSKVAEGKQEAQKVINEQFDNGGEQAMQADYQKKYEDEKKKLKESYERDLAALRKYLSASDSKGNMKAAITSVIALIDKVDFSAQLTSNNRFANKDYEAQSYNWKFTYRAGKENAMLVRAAAAQWLSELK